MRFDIRKSIKMRLRPGLCSGSRWGNLGEPGELTALPYSPRDILARLMKRKGLHGEGR